MSIPSSVVEKSAWTGFRATILERELTCDIDLPTFGTVFCLLSRFWYLMMSVGDGVALDSIKALMYPTADCEDHFSFVSWLKLVC